MTELQLLEADQDARTVRRHRVLVLAALLASVLLLACGPSEPEIRAVPTSGTVDQPTVIGVGVTRGQLWAQTPPLPTSTTTSPPPPTTAASVTRSERAANPAPAPSRLGPAESPCGGWRGLIAAYFPADAVDAACVIVRCETGETFDPAIIGGPNTNGTYDVGLFQINDIHGLTVEERQDPETNVAFAARLYAESGWRPWTCRKALA